MTATSKARHQPGGNGPYLVEAVKKASRVSASTRRRTMSHEKSEMYAPLDVCTCRERLIGWGQEKALRSCFPLVDPAPPFPFSD